MKLLQIYALSLLSLPLSLAIWVLWAVNIRLRSHSVILLTNRGSEKPFFQRNKDNLILAVIAALLGAVLGVGGTLIVNHFQNIAPNTIVCLKPKQVL